MDAVGAAVSAMDFKALEQNILHSSRRSPEQHWEDVNGEGGLLSLLQGETHTAMRDKVLHRWREKDGPQAVLGEALGYVKAQKLTPT